MECSLTTFAILIAYASCVYGLNVDNLAGHCCDLGRAWAIQSQEMCGAYPATYVLGPVISSAQDTVACIAVIDVCCVGMRRERQCTAGKDTAIMLNTCEGLHIYQANEDAKECCNCCQLGLLMVRSGQQCQFPGQLVSSMQCVETFMECCVGRGHPPEAAVVNDTLVLQHPSNRVSETDFRSTETDFQLAETVQPIRQTTTPSNPATPQGDRSGDGLIPVLSNIDECSQFEGELCSHICIDTLESYTCACNEGFTLLSDGKSCARSEEIGLEDCRLERLACASHERCIETGGGYSCVDGSIILATTTTQQVITTTQKPKTTTTQLNAIHAASTGAITPYPLLQISITGTPERCRVGFAWNRFTQECEDIDECVIGLDTCQPAEVCLNTNGGFQCREEDPGLEEDVYDDSSIEDSPEGFHFQELSLEGENDPQTTATALRGQEELPSGVQRSDIYRDSRTFVGQAPIASVVRQPEGTDSDQPEIETDDIEPEMTYNRQLLRTEQAPLGTIHSYPDRPTSDYFPNIMRASTLRQEITFAQTKTTKSTPPPPPPPTTTPPLSSTTTTSSSTTTTSVRNRMSTVTHDIRDDYHDVTVSPSASTSGRQRRLSSTKRKVPTTGRAPRTRKQSTTNVRASPVTQITSSFDENVQCLTGYRYNPTRRQCLDIDECSLPRQYSCARGQKCLNTPGSFECTCDMGYVLDQARRRCVDVDECRTMSDVCSVQETCENTPGSYRCVRTQLVCGRGFILHPSGRHCIDLDECRLEVHDCNITTECLNTAGSFECVTKQCSNGFSLNQQTGRCDPRSCPRGHRMNATGHCYDINECLERRDNCRSHQECHNTIGSFTCRNVIACGTGYELDESNGRCKDIDECQQDPSPCSGSNVRCINRPGSYICQCSDGYAMDQLRKRCEDVDECHQYGQVCPSNADCENVPGSFRCICHEGFELESGEKTCRDVDECLQQQMCQHTCHNTWGSFQCACNNGYQLAPDGKTCQDIDECSFFSDRGTQLCQGICENTAGSYRCRCPDGYVESSDGRTCRDVDECSDNSTDCKGPDDVCINTRGGYKCEVVRCPKGFAKAQASTNATGNNIRCQRKTFTCPQGDVECMYAPLSYSAHFIAIQSKLIHVPADLFTMRGPDAPNRRLQFELDVNRARNPETGNPGVGRDHFHLKQLRPSEVVVQLIQGIDGPQDIELQLNMNVYSKEFRENAEEIFFGTAVARIFVYMTEDPWLNKIITNV